MGGEEEMHGASRSAEEIAGGAMAGARGGADERSGASAVDVFAEARGVYGGGVGRRHCWRGREMGREEREGELFFLGNLVGHVIIVFFFLLSARFLCSFFLFKTELK